MHRRRPPRAGVVLLGRRPSDLGDSGSAKTRSRSMSTSVPRAVPFRLGLPKGRMEQGVLTLLSDAGIRVRPSARGYRPDVSLPGAEAKLLKPQNIVEMLALGSRDAGFAGADWVAELEGGPDVVELLDTGLDAVVAVLPSMRQATVAPLFGNGGYAVKAAVPRELLPQVIPAVKAAGGTDVVVSTFSQIVP